MIIPKIELQGFSSFKNHTIIEWPLGITGIVGVKSNNPDRSNGCGKSSLVMSIIYALFGKGEFDTITDLINDEVDEMFIKLFFELNNSSYILERGIRKGSSYINFFENGIKLGKGVTDAQEEIIKVLGMDYPMLSASNFFEQNMMDKFINSDSEQRRKYIDKVIGNDLWTNLYKKSSKEYKEICAEIKNIDDKLSQFSMELTDNKKLIENKQTIIDNISKLTKDKELLDNELSSLAKLEIAIQNKDKIKTAYNSCASTIGDLVLQKSSYVKPRIDNSPAITQSTKSAEETHAVMDQLSSEITDLTDLIEKLTEEKQKVYTKHMGLTSDRKSLEKSGGNLTEGACPTCKQDVTSTHLTTLELSLKNSLKELDEDILVEKNIMDKISSELTEKTTSRQLISDEYSILKTKYQNIQVEITRLTSEQASNDLLYKEMDNFIKTIDDSINKTTLEQTKLKEELDFFEKNKYDEAKILKDINLVKSQMEITNTSIATANIELGKVLNIEKTIESLQTKTSELQLTKQTMQTTSKHYEVALLGFEHIPKQVFDTAIKDVEEEVNTIMKQIYPKFDVKIYEDDTKKTKPLVISCVTDKGHHRSYKRLSGGQKTIFNIALRLGFSKIIMNKANTSLQFLVLDEPFGALDVNSRVEIKKMFSILAQTFKQIFIITHTDDLADFPNIITVKMDENEVSYL